MTTNILYYGNCQLYAIKTLLNLQSVNESLIECFDCELDKWNEEEFKKKVLLQDIIITQPIKDDYRNVHYLSTNYIINNCKHDCKIIIVDSCHFDFYYFDLTYKFWNEKLLREPDDYHYYGMMECFKKKESIDYYLDNYVNNVDLKSKEDLENLAYRSIEELERRYNENCVKYKTTENIFILTSSEYIRNNFKEKLLFYSMNHPTKYVIQNICEQIIFILNRNNTIRYDVDVLNHYKSILYKSVQKVVNFDLNDHKPHVNNNITAKDIAQLYYETYQNIGFN